MSLIMIAAYISGVSATVYSLFLEQQMMCIAIQDTHGLKQWGSQ